MTTHPPEDSSSAEAPDPDKSEPIAREDDATIDKSSAAGVAALNLTGFFPAPIATLLQSKEWEKYGLLPIVQSREVLKRPAPRQLALPYPQPGIGRIIIKGKGETSYGSGFLIWTNPFVLLTAGHLVADVTAAQVEVWLPGLTGQPGLKNGLYNAPVVGIAAYGGWRDSDTDFAVISVSGVSNYNNIIQPMEITNYNKLRTGCENASISGYRQGHYDQTSGSGPFNPALNGPYNNVVGCSIISYQGESGAPIFAYPNGQCQAVGIQGFIASSGLSYGSMINSVIRAQLATWVGHDVCVSQP